jgi:kynureninase
MTVDDAAALDARDPLAPFAAEFHHPLDPAGRRAIYLCGHSLGLQPRAAAGCVEHELAVWRDRAVLGHHDGPRAWMRYHERFASPLGELCGAMPTEVVAMNSLTVNLHLLLVSFFQPTPARNRILIEKPAFPSDRYAVVSQLAFHGLEPAAHLIEVGPRPGEECLRTEDLLAAIERNREHLALVLLPGVQYLTGQCLEVAPLVAAAHAAGARIGFDLAHAIGNTPLRLHDWDVDFAVWCSYKYLNGGPGAIGGAFVHERHARRVDLPRFAGWWGHDPDTRFAMPADFTPIPGAEGWQLSNPPVLAAAPLIASLDVFRRAGLGRLREKSLALTGFLRRSLEAALPPGGLEILTPLEPAAHGCQLSVRLRAGGRRVFERLAAAGVVADWREPDVLRLAPTPAYNSFSEVRRAATALADAARS